MRDFVHVLEIEMGDGAGHVGASRASEYQALRRIPSNAGGWYVDMTNKAFDIKMTI